VGKSRDRANRSGTDPINIGNARINLDSAGSSDLRVTAQDGTTLKKVFAAEVQVGTGDDRVILKRDSSSGKVQFQTTDGSTTSETSVGTGVVTNPSDLPLSGNNAGDTKFVTSTNNLMIFNGTGWYKIATVTNATPTISSAGSASNTFATDGTPISIEIVAADPEGLALQYKYQITTGSLGSTAAVTNSATSGGTYSALAANTYSNNRFFKVTPSTNSDHAGTFAITFSVTDGINTAVSSASSFTLEFSVSGSYKFDGTGDGITVPTSTDFNFGTGDFSIEAFVQSNVHSGYPYIIDLRDEDGSPTSQAAPLIYIDNSNQILYYVSGSARITVDYSPYDNKFTHVAVQRVSGTTALYLDGDRKGTWSDSTDYNQSSPIVRLGSRAGNPSQSLNGYMSNVRIVKGSVAHSEAASPYSGSIDLQGGQVSTSNSSDFTMGTGDYTIELWFNLDFTFNTNTSQNDYFFDLGGNGLYAKCKNGEIQFRHIHAASGPLVSYSTGTTGLVTGQWYHLAIVKDSSNNVKMYLDGTNVASNTGATQDHTTNTMALGGYQGGGSYTLDAQITDFRIVKGKAVYTGNFTRPSGALTTTGGTYPSSTNIVNPTAAETVMLVGNNSSSITDVSDTPHTMTTSGTVAASSAVPIGVTIPVPTTNLSSVTNTKLLALAEDEPNIITNGSTNFSATNTKLTTSASSNLTLGTGDFTVEGWFNWANLPGSGKYILDFGSNGYVMQFQSNTSLGFWNATNSYVQGSYTFATNTWYHIAWTRTSGTGKCYVNGTEIASGTANKDITTNTLTMNGYGGGGSYGQVDVKHSDFRVVKGLAVYTGAFSVPTGPLTKTGGTYPNNTNRTDPSASQTVLLTHQSSSGSFPIDNSDSGITFSNGAAFGGSISLGAGIQGASVDATGKTLTNVGDVQHSYASPFEQGTGGSIYFDGTTDWISGTVAAAGTSDFVMEMFVKPITNDPTGSTGYSGMAHIRPSAMSGTGTNSGIGFNYTGGGTGMGNYNRWTHLFAGTYDMTYDGIQNPALAPSTDSWTHVAYIRTGDLLRLFVGGKGVLKIENDTTDYSTSTHLGLGAYHSTASSMYGYISNFRYIVGSSPYSVSGYSTGGSTNFPNGASDALLAASMPALGADDWTVEFYVKLSHTFAMGFIQVGKDNGSLSIYLNGSNKLVVEGNQTGAGYTSATSLTTNGWHHIAVVNDGTANTQTTYINGSADANTGSRSTAYTYTEDTVIIGAKWYSGAIKETAYRYISNVRITKAKVYTDNFIVPWSPLTAITNCQLLTCQNSSGAITDASTNNLTMTASGSVAAATGTAYHPATGIHPFIGQITPPTSALTAITNTKLLTAQHSNKIIDASAENVSLTVNGDAVATRQSPFG